MERNTFSGDNSVPSRIRISLLSNLMLLYESLTAYAAGKNGITSCLPTNQKLDAVRPQCIIIGISA